ncbi:MAG: hypothetical protein JXA73_21090 [Acidobacteria bacterium]|nr:hypothetical protein [Acidobacteriota bacterium]
MEVVTDAIEKGLSFEQTVEELSMADVFAQMPKEGPGAGFLRLNVKRLYEVLKK